MGGGGGYWKMTQNVTMGEGGIGVKHVVIISTRYF